MSDFTPRANLRLPGGGSTGTILPDEQVDIDVLNDNFRKIDALLGARSVPSASSYAGSMDGDLVYARDTEFLHMYSADTGGLISPRLPGLPPVGSVFAWTTNTAPDTYLLCQGQEISTAAYPELFTVLGHLYGGSGATFKLPDLQGRTIVGVSTADTEFDTLGKEAGAKTHTLTIAQLPAFSGVSGSSQASAAQGSYTGVPIRQTYGSGQAHNNIQPSTALNYIIRAL